VRTSQAEIDEAGEKDLLLSAIAFGASIPGVECALGLPPSRLALSIDHDESQNRGRTLNGSVLEHSIDGKNFGTDHGTIICEDCRSARGKKRRVMKTYPSIETSK
jgi:hypothetical protein